MLSLGSNQGDRLAWLARTGDALNAWPGIRVLESSRVYETEPVDVAPVFAGHLYLNRIVVVGTTLAADDFSRAIHAIEKRLGRTRGSVHNMPRTVDIDIITFGALRSNAPDLTLPHPRARERRFVLQPLAELRPDLILPGERLTVSDLLRALPEVPRVTLFVP